MLALLALALMPTDHHNESAADAREFYELRTYTVPNRDGQIDQAAHDKVMGYVTDTLVPALKRVDGLGPIGVFTEAGEQPRGAAPTGNVYLLIPAADVATLANLGDTLAADETYRQAAAPFHATPAKEAPYQRAESKLMRAFADIPTLVAPKPTDGRVFELRTYQSGNAGQARLKVEMFNEGEIDIMRDQNLAPVFYGETLIGGDAPNLAYMLSAPSLDDHKRNWQSFLDAPAWKQMSGLPRYKGTVSKIDQVFLVPADGSEI